MHLVARAVLAREEKNDASATDAERLAGGSLASGTPFLVRARGTRGSLSLLLGGLSSPVALAPALASCTALECAGPYVLSGDASGVLALYDANAAFAGRPTACRPQLLVALRPSPIVCISFAFERLEHTGGSSSLPSGTPSSSHHALVRAIGGRQVLDSVWVLHGSGEVLSMGWAEMLRAAVGGDDAAADRPPPAPHHVRWTLSPAPRSLACLAVLNPPTCNLFDESASSSLFSFSRGDGVPAPGGEGDEGEGPTLTLVVAGSHPPILAYRLPVHRRPGSLTELAVSVSDSISWAARGVARELRGALPTPVRARIAHGLTQLGAGGLLNSLSAWVKADRVVEASGEEDGPSAGETPLPPLLPSPAGLPRVVSTGMGFYDGDRTLLRAAADPTGRFVATADTWGRVAVLGAEAGASTSLSLLALRKGHRDASLGWLLTGGKPDGGPLSLLCLIHSPHRGSLEALCCPSGVPAGPPLPVGRSARLVASSSSAGCCVILSGQYPALIVGPPRAWVVKEEEGGALAVLEVCIE